MDGYFGYGGLLSYLPSGSWFLIAAGVVALGFFGAPFAFWTVAVVAALWFQAAPVWLLGTVTAVLVLLNIPAVRNILLSSRVAIWQVEGYF